MCSIILEGELGEENLNGTLSKRGERKKGTIVSASSSHEDEKCQRMLKNCAQGGVFGTVNNSQKL